MRSFTQIFAITAMLLCLGQTASAQIVISGYIANPAGFDSPFEYVQLVATQSIDFSTDNFSVVFGNNGTATAAGWVNGAGLTYGFNLTAGTVAVGETFYVGGSGMLINGAGSTDISSEKFIRTINTATTNGDGFGNFNTGGVLGNGGVNADGIAVFGGLTTVLTSSTVPLDSLFFGTGIGAALVNGGVDGYQLAVNDLYAGGKLQSNSFLFSDPTNGGYSQLTGTYDLNTSTWTTARTLTTVASPTTLSDIASDITLTPVPEPATVLGFSALMLGAVGYVRRKRQQAVLVA